MLDLKKLGERYKDVGLGVCRFGGRNFYEVNSDTPLSLNSYGGTMGFVLNDKEEVELFNLSEKVLVKRHYYLTEDWNDEDEVEYETEYYWDETEPKKWWGKTLDNYYPHPWYPERKIVAFQLINNVPLHNEGTVFKVKQEIYPYIIVTTISGEIYYQLEDCLNCPEFFKPIYE